MFRDKKKLEEIYSSKRTWSRMGNGMFTRYAKNLKPEERLKVISGRCGAVLGTFIELDKIAAIRKDPRLGKIMEYITTESMGEPMDRAKKNAMAFFALGGTPSEAEDFIKKLEGSLSVAAIQVLAWELPDFSKGKAGMEESEYEKLDRLSHELRNTLTTVGARMTLMLIALKEFHSDIHEPGKQE